MGGRSLTNSRNSRNSRNREHPQESLRYNKERKEINHNTQKSKEQYNEEEGKEVNEREEPTAKENRGERKRERERESYWSLSGVPGNDKRGGFDYLKFSPEGHASSSHDAIPVTYY